MLIKLEKKKSEKSSNATFMYMDELERSMNMMDMEIIAFPPISIQVKGN